MNPTAKQVPRVCLLFLFNHKFERNLPMLERVYSGRFSHRHVLMPFASNPGPGVSRIYELGRHFGGHFAQGARDFIREEYTHYVVVPDDLMLNPRIDETNLLEWLGLGWDEAYITNLIAADALRYRWPHAGDAAAAFERYSKAVDLAGLLPTASEARSRFERIGIVFPETRAGLVARARAHRKLARASVWAYVGMLSLRGRPASYPLLAGYADFLVVPASAIEDFVHYCGVLSALNIFAEVAVPTALALSAASVRTELELNHHFHERGGSGKRSNAPAGVRIWDEDDRKPYAALLDRDFDGLQEAFPADALYIHPVKLSAYL